MPMNCQQKNINILTAEASSIHHQGHSTSYHNIGYSHFLHNYVPKSSPQSFLTIFTQIFLSLTSQSTQNQRALHHLVPAALGCVPRLLTANRSLRTSHISQPPWKQTTSAAQIQKKKKSMLQSNGCEKGNVETVRGFTVLLEDISISFRWADTKVNYQTTLCQIQDQKWI